MDLPKLAIWNYDACEHHTEPDVSCSYQACGGEPFNHQTVSAAFHLAAKKSLNSSKPGAGKAQPLSAKILTPTGWKTMGDMGVGTPVITPSGDIAKVTGVYPQGVQPVYRITLNDGSVTHATLDHLWKVDVGHGKCRHSTVLTTKRMLEIGLHKPDDGRCRFALPKIMPRHDKDHPLQVHPYALGAMLGDGGLTRSSLTFTTKDLENHDNLRDVLPTGLELIPKAVGDYRLAGRDIVADQCVSYYCTKPRVTSTGWCSTCGAFAERHHIQPNTPRRNSLNSIGWYLRSNSLTVLSKLKFIPESYKKASYSQRVDLLRGLMDTDGSISNGCMEYTSASQQLSNDVAGLIRSLGGYAKVTHKQVPYTYKGHFQLKDAWRVTFNCPINPFKLRRKAEQWDNSTSQKERRIDSIEYSHDEEVQCIQIEHHEHLYITDDYIVTHNTNSALLTLALAQHYYTEGRLPKPVRAVIVVPTVAVNQWAHEVQRWTPGFRVTHIPKGSTPKQRLDIYTSYKDWDILIIGYHAFTIDKDYISNIPINFLISDDVDPLHKTENATHKAIVQVANKTEWVIVTNATPTQTHLNNLYGATMPIGAKSVWGTKTAFERTYVKRSPVYIVVGKDSQGNLLQRRTMPVTGYKNMDDLAAKFANMHIRYTYEQIAGDVRMPSIVTTDVPLGLHPEQRRRYAELQDGLMTLLNETNGKTPQQKMVSALAKFSYGNMICAGLPALGEKDGPSASTKLDWIEDNIDSSFEDDKVVVYAVHKGTIAALKARLDDKNIGYATIDGSTKDKRAEQSRFWEDPDCRVMLLSAAGERSLNLQCANVLIMLDSQYNPARVQQIAGRLRRAGSHHSTVRVFRLYTTDTQEERVAKVLSARQAVADAVNQETDDSQLFQTLDPDEILKLIRPW